MDFSKLNLKALLLDLDGTLINSEKAFFNSFKKILSDDYNIDITMDLYKKYELEQNAMLIKTLKCEHLAIKDVQEECVMRKIYDDYENSFKEVIKETEAKDNFKLLKEIKERGLRLALVTTCRRKYIDILLKDLGLETLFECIIAREDVVNLKPSKDAYEIALKQMNLNPRDCIAIEDSKRGIDAAISANIKVIKVDSFTAIKYTDKRAIEFESSNYVLKEILKYS